MANAAAKAAEKAEKAAAKTEGEKTTRPRLTAVEKARKVRDDSKRKVDKLQKKVDAMKPTYEKAVADLEAETKAYNYAAAHPLLAEEQATPVETETRPDGETTAEFVVEEAGPDEDPGTPESKDPLDFS